MGDAIARYREAALKTKRAADTAFIHPAHLLLGISPTKAATIEARLLSGTISPREFARLLRDAAKTRSVPGRRSPVADGVPLFDHKRKSMLARVPGSRECARLLAAALVEARAAGGLFEHIERRLSALSTATESMRAMAADSWGSRYSLTKSDYAKHLLRWQRAFDALAPFIEEPPAPAATSEKKPSGTKQKKRRDRKGVGGAPEKYPMKFIREVFTARERDQKHAAKAKQRLPSFSRWLWDFCESRLNVVETFPPAFKGEPWEARAERFRRAATKRLREGGN